MRCGGRISIVAARVKISEGGESEVRDECLCVGVCVEPDPNGPFNNFSLFFFFFFFFFFKISVKKNIKKKIKIKYKQKK